MDHFTILCLLSDVMASYLLDVLLDRYSSDKLSITVQTLSRSFKLSTQTAPSINPNSTEYQPKQHRELPRPT